jgi:hypothetical protein
MRLRIFEHLRRFALRAGSRRGPYESAAAEPHGRHRRSPAPPVSQPPLLVPPPPRPTPTRPSADSARVGAARARIREKPPESLEAAQAAQAAPPVVNHERAAARQPWYQNVATPVVASQVRQPPRRGLNRQALPFATPHSEGMPPTADGRRNTGALERILWRQWDPSVPPPPDVVTAINRLAEFPERIKDKLVAGLDGIYVGPGGVPELDDMTGLRGVALPSGRASWDACAGAYGERKIVIGSRPSPTPDVTCHEVGHALDDLDSPPGKWQSDSAEFRMLYDLCQQYLVSDFHRQPGGLGRKEFFADAFAAIASSQRPALVDMLGGQTTTALRVMLYFNRRYGL